MNTIKEKFHQAEEEWAILPGPNWAPGETEGLLSRGCQPDPRVALVLDDPRVGRLAYWGSNHRALVRAVVLVDGQEESLLLEDWTGYPWIRVFPWIRVSPDARLIEKCVKCVRVYLDGSRHQALLTPEEAEQEATYNRQARPGVAFFTDGECRQTGYLSFDRCVEIGKELAP